MWKHPNNEAAKQREIVYLTHKIKRDGRFDVLLDKSTINLGDEAMRYAAPIKIGGHFVAKVFRKVQ